MTCPSKFGLIEAILNQSGLISNNDSIFTYVMPGKAPLIWNVTTAKRAVMNGNTIRRVAIEREEMEQIAMRNEFAEATVATADPSRPGIGAPFIWEGRIEYLLIDGTHRCVRALRDGLLFEVDLLCARNAGRITSDAAADRPTFSTIQK